MMTLSQHLAHVRKLDLGCGATPQPGYVGLDAAVHAPVEGREVWQLNLATGDPWPLSDEQVTDLYSSHLIEHLPAQDVRAHQFVDAAGARSKVPGLQRYHREQDALFWFMDECWRICVPGARFELRWPALVDLRESAERPDHPPRWLVAPFMDPTHRRFIPVETLAYFDRCQREEAGLSGYAVSCDWVLVDLLVGILGCGHLENIAILEKRAT